MDWGVPLDDGFEPGISFNTLAPELRTAADSAPPTADADIYALGRLGYYILTGGNHRPADKEAPLQLNRDDLACLLPQLDGLELVFPGATDLLASWLIDRQPVGESLNSQYLLRLAASGELDLLDGW